MSSCFTSHTTGVCRLTILNYLFVFCFLFPWDTLIWRNYAVFWLYICFYKTYIQLVLSIFFSISRKFDMFLNQSLHPWKQQDFKTTWTLWICFNSIFYRHQNFVYISSCDVQSKIINESLTKYIKFHTAADEYNVAQHSQIPTVPVKSCNSAQRVW